jgi:TolB protein
MARGLETLTRGLKGLGLVSVLGANLIFGNCDYSFCADTVKQPEKILSLEEISFKEHRIVYLSNKGLFSSIYSINPDGSDKRCIVSNRTIIRSCSLSPENKKIVFDLNLVFNCNREIYLIDIDGNNEKRLTFDNSHNIYPIWSPDGKKIAFESESYGFNEEYSVMNNNGNNKKKIIKQGTCLTWSRDSKRLLFKPYKDGNDQIFSINPDGSDLRQLTNNEFFIESFSLSPDNKKIAFLSNRLLDAFIKNRIYVINYDGSDERRLTDNNFDIKGFLRWSPDGNKIAFINQEKTSDTEEYELHVINSDGSGEKKLTDKGSFIQSHQWIPNSNKILFLSYDNKKSEIYTINPDGSDKKRLTIDDNLDKDINLSPDYKKIYYVSNIDGHEEIFIMNIDGSDKKRLTYDHGFNRNLAILPVNR